MVQLYGVLTIITQYRYIHVSFSQLDRALWFFADPGMIFMYALLIAVPMWAGRANADLALWEKKAANCPSRKALFYFLQKCALHNKDSHSRASTECIAIL